MQEVLGFAGITLLVYFSRMAGSLVIVLRNRKRSPEVLPVFEDEIKE